jgi:FtsH-binding integral membrane protein
MRVLVYMFGLSSAGFALWALTSVVAWQFNIASYRATREPLIGAFLLLVFALASGVLSAILAWLTRKDLRRADIWFVWGIIGGLLAIVVAFFAADASAA